MKTNGTTIVDASYKGFPSIVMENGFVRLELVPELGAKLVSMVYKPTGKEWLLDSGSRPLLPPVYGSSFANGDMSGWDECFPTINSCVTESGATLPDHGEAWSLPWSYRRSGTSVLCTVKGVMLPFLFSREVTFMENGTIRLSYEVRNEGERPQPFLWAAHPQFAIEEPTEIVLPSGMQQLLCVYGGMRHDTGQSYAFTGESLLRPDITGDGRKFYYPGQAPEGWAALHGQASGNYLRLRWPLEQVPYFGVWIDEGMFNDRSVCALEPGIGYYDALDAAVQNGTARTLMPAEAYSWHLDIELGIGDLD
ncbi:galactose mutarotase-like enzyme [Paenibacillus endophyticus]|uniref:Galactose mutarotase-like enzyme n=1 Tax=Paenibacillus endophyticus TaxID=1294268 RepID=A0A7W5C4N5_9BACL|nr:hypothetical protein [Paenibacillus endophyticus]MBB3150817.1 galactose mutarotase-like enzyme [Paenibacillus endophyticus]